MVGRKTGREVLHSQSSLQAKSQSNQASLLTGAGANQDSLEALLVPGFFHGLHSVEAAQHHCGGGVQDPRHGRLSFCSHCYALVVTDCCVIIIPIHCHLQKGART